MTSFLTLGNLNDDDDDEGNAEILSNPNNSTRSDFIEGRIDGGGEDGSSSRITKSELLASNSRGENDENEDDDDDFDSKAATNNFSEDRSRLSTAASKSPQPQFATSTTTCELLAGLPTLEVNELNYPDFLLVQRLRCRAHGLLLHAAAHSVYMVNVFNALRLKALDIVRPETKYTRRITDSRHPDPAKIAIIGGGRLGRLILKCLLTFGSVEPQNICVGTRHPDQLELLKGKGINVLRDNVTAVGQADIVFVCVPPHMHVEVLKQLNDAVRPNCLVVTFVPPFTAKKLRCYAPKIKNLLRPEYELAEANQEQQTEWNCTVTFPDILEIKPYVEVTSPMIQPTVSKGSSNKRPLNPPAKCGDRLLETFFYAAFNHCCQLGLTWQRAMDCLNIVIFNCKFDTEDHALEPMIQIHDVVLSNTAPAASPVLLPITALSHHSQGKQPASPAPPPPAIPLSGRSKSLTTIENQIDNMLKSQYPAAVDLIDVYSVNWTPFRSALFEEPDDAVLRRRQAAYQRGYWQQFKKYLEWRKWNYPPDVSFIN